MKGETTVATQTQYASIQSEVSTVAVRPVTMEMENHALGGNVPSQTAQKINNVCQKQRLIANVKKDSDLTIHLLVLTLMNVQKANATIQLIASIR